MEFPPLMAALLALPVVILAFSFQGDTAARFIGSDLDRDQLDLNPRNFPSTMDAKISIRSSSAKCWQSLCPGTSLKKANGLSPRERDQGRSYVGWCPIKMPHPDTAAMMPS
jgi:hypothetical protein